MPDFVQDQHDESPDITASLVTTSSDEIPESEDSYDNNMNCTTDDSVHGDSSPPGLAQCVCHKKPQHIGPEYGGPLPEGTTTMAV